MTKLPLTPRTKALPALRLLAGIVSAQIATASWAEWGDNVRFQRYKSSELQEKLLTVPYGRQLLAQYPLSGCDIMMYKINYSARGADQNDVQPDTYFIMMVPDGGNNPASSCISKPLPIVLYAHDYSPAPEYNLATLDNPANPAYNEAMLNAAMYAAQGNIVVAPHYSGWYRTSDTYHSHFELAQQVRDMRKALDKARLKIAAQEIEPGLSASSELLITGYGQGGSVALATAKALETAGQHVSATVAIAGPYALANHVQSIMFGASKENNAYLLPLLASTYARTDSSLMSQGKSVDVTKPAYIKDYLEAQNELRPHPFRTAILRNDLSQAPAPSRQVLLCGSSQDKVVSYDLNTMAIKTKLAGNIAGSSIDAFGWPNAVDLGAADSRWDNTAYSVFERSIHSELQAAAQAGPASQMPLDAFSRSALLRLVHDFDLRYSGTEASADDMRSFMDNSAPLQSLLNEKERTQIKALSADVFSIWQAYSSNYQADTADTLLRVGSYFTSFLLPSSAAITLTPNRASQILNAINKKRQVYAEQQYHALLAPYCSLFGLTHFKKVLGEIPTDG